MSHTACASFASCIWRFVTEAGFQVSKLDKLETAALMRVLTPTFGSSEIARVSSNCDCG